MKTEKQREGKGPFFSHPSSLVEVRRWGCALEFKMSD
jgi:hypothetical protein